MGGTGNGNPTNSIEKMSGDKWERIPQTLPTTRRDFCAVYYKNELVVIGGVAPGDNGRNTVESLNFSTGKWTTLPPVPAPSLVFHTCAVFNDSIYVAGGAYAQQQKVYRYSNGAWQRTPDLTKKRWSHAMGVTDGRLTVAGGYGSGGSAGSLDTIEMMDNDGNWEEMPWRLSWKGQYPAMTSIPAAMVPTTPAASQTTTQAPTAAASQTTTQAPTPPPKDGLEGHAVFMGGWDTHNKYAKSPNAELLKADGKSTTTLPALPEGRMSLKGAYLNGKVWACGGQGKAVPALKTCYTLDSPSSNWTLGPELVEKRYMFDMIEYFQAATFQLLRQSVGQ